MKRADAGAAARRAAEALVCVLRPIRAMRNPGTNHTDQPGLRCDPDEWKTGDEPVTNASGQT